LFGENEDALKWFIEGLKLFNEKKFEEALRCFDKAIEINPNFADVWLTKGSILGILGRYEEALQCFDRALEIDPNLDLAEKAKKLTENRLKEELIREKLSSIKKEASRLESKGIPVIVSGDIRNLYQLIRSKRYNQVLKELERIERELRELESKYERTRIELQKEITEAESSTLMDSIRITDPEEDLKALYGLIEGEKPKILLNLNQTEFNLNEWQRVRISVRNEGLAHAYNLTLSFSEDFEARGIEPLTVKANETKTIEVGIKPKFKGDVPLEIKASFEDGKGRKYEEKYVFWTYVSESKETEKLAPIFPSDFTPKPTTPKTFPPELSEIYTEVEFIGKGGFASVFKAKRKDGRVVAVKIPISLDAATGKSFIRELQNWTRLKHGNIVSIYDYNILPIPHIEMELCDCSLADIAKPMDVREAAYMIFNVADGLRYAHSLPEPIIHRDLKPQNILLKDCIPKISDWGLSKVLTESTSTVVSFTPLYAAPEQISRKFGKPDERTDIWQLGVIFYELVTGELPFKGEDFTELTSAIVLEDPMLPSELNPDAKEVEHVIMTCLQKNMQERYQSMADLQKELSVYLSISCRESLKKSINDKDLSRSAYYCGELMLINLKIGDGAGAYKYAGDLLEYCRGELQEEIKALVGQIKVRLEEKLEIPQELIERAEILVHKLKLGFERV